jgi:Zn-dependent peptidase ImmA (M78 family)
VPPRSWDDIHDLVEKLRGHFGLSNEPYFPIIEFIEKVLDQKLSWLQFVVGDDETMEGAEGLTAPDGSFIMLREDVYESACGGEGRARFTSAHELGHWILHTNVPFARVEPEQLVKPFRLSEPQANQFAAELLMPRDFFSWADSAESVMKRHGVSRDAAQRRLVFLQKKGLL